MSGYRRFVKRFMVLTVLLCASASALSYFSVMNNPLYVLAQNKIREAKNRQEFEIVFVGDSSAVAAVDAEYFSSLANAKTINLATTGTHNFAGSFNLIRHSINSMPNLKVIVIMQNPSVWSREFQLLGYFSTQGNLDSAAPTKFGLVHGFDYIAHHFLNGSAVKEFRITGNPPDDENKEWARTFANGKLSRPAHEKISSEIGTTKKRELEMMDDYISGKGIKVIWLQGPLHYDVYVKSQETIKKQHQMLETMKNIVFINNPLYVPNENMGDTTNHVDRTYKKEATRFYFQILQGVLPKQ